MLATFLCANVVACVIAIHVGLDRRGRKVNGQQQKVYEILVRLDSITHNGLGLPGGFSLGNGRVLNGKDGRHSLSYSAEHR